MDGLPVTVRLLDPPLHEFLPHDRAGQAEMAKVLGVSPTKCSTGRSRSCTSSTPCSATAAAAWASPTPRSSDMQMRAIAEAAVDVGKTTATRRCPK